MFIEYMIFNKQTLTASRIGTFYNLDSQSIILKEKNASNADAVVIFAADYPQDAVLPIEGNGPYVVTGDVVERTFIETVYTSKVKVKNVWYFRKI